MSAARATIDESHVRRVYEESGRNKRETMRRTGLGWRVVRRIVEGQDAGLSPLGDKPGGAPEDFQNDSAVALALQKRPLTLAEIAAAGRVSERTAAEWVEEKRAKGFSIIQRGDTFQWIRVVPTGNAGGRILEYVSRPDNTFVFGACGDQHLGSKYERLDVLENLYDEFARAGVDRVFNTGNWIDGEAPFNLFDLKVHGLDGQLKYLAAHYPRRRGFDTYAVSGNDHEGWYNKRLGVEVGIYAERAMLDAGRDDWHHLGFMQANVRLVNANTGRASTLTVMHPGGGSAYAVSYKPQKIVEGFSGGEKPAVLLIGHYHKLSVNLIRNVWAIQTGCSQDQTPFMMQKLIEPHVGGVVVKIEQDPRTGAIVRCVPDIRNYFVRDYYNGRWSMAGDVVLPERGIA